MHTLMLASLSIDYPIHFARRAHEYPVTLNRIQSGFKPHSGCGLERLLSHYWLQGCNWCERISGLCIYVFLDQSLKTISLSIASFETGCNRLFGASLSEPHIVVLCNSHTHTYSLRLPMKLRMLTAAPTKQDIMPRETCRRRVLAALHICLQAEPETLQQLDPT